LALWRSRRTPYIVMLSGFPPGGQPRCGGTTWRKCDLGSVHNRGREDPENRHLSNSAWQRGRRLSVSTLRNQRHAAQGYEPYLWRYAAKFK
jgi:hypothetical protein